MHSLSRLTPYKRKEIYRKYTERMSETKWKWKEKFYETQSVISWVHLNTIRKICQRWRYQDFEDHKSVILANRSYGFKIHIRREKKLNRRLKREREIIRYEREMAWELGHIDLHKCKNIKWSNPKKKKYAAAVVDDATRMKYLEILPNKKAKTLAAFMKRAYVWFQKRGITFKRLLSDNGLEFTTHHKTARPEHSFEKMLLKLNIVHKYTKIRRPQTNGKVERFWRIFNEEFFFKYTFSSWKECNIQMKDWMSYYNTKRKHWGIKYMTPFQKFEKLLLENKVCV